MVLLQCDYQEGTHPRILDAIVKTNFEQTPGYSTDIYSDKAKEAIKKTFNCPNADVHILVGGTQTNKTVIGSLLKKHQGVISADTGHVATHESGAIESSGHKVITIPHIEGKIFAKEVRDMLSLHYSLGNREHEVQPGMVYISNPTENGTLYTKKELHDLKEVCDEYDIPLFLDGARLGYALASPDNDIQPEDYSKYCDIYYIGGTKVGALFGEAVVITNDRYKKDFRYHIKQNGGLFAKGRLLGIQFLTLFEDGLYQEISKNAIDLAYLIKKEFQSFGIKLLFDSPTNQQFFIIENSLLAKIEEKFLFQFWHKEDENHTAVRVCTSWATKKEDIDELISYVKSLV